MITACVYVSIFFNRIRTLSRVLFYAGVRLVPFFTFWYFWALQCPNSSTRHFFYPCYAISFAGIVALIYYCIGCNGGASVSCWLHGWCIVSHASHTITVTGSAAAAIKSKPEFCIRLPVILLASCFRLQFALWFEMH